MTAITSKLAKADRVAHLLRSFDGVPNHAHLLRVANDLGDLTLVLRFALGRPVRLRDPALRGAAVAVELESRAASFIRHVFFREGATHYELLGLARDASRKTVQENFRLLMQLIHPDRRNGGSYWPESFATRANLARTVLKDARTRAAYDAALAIPDGIRPGRVEVVRDRAENGRHAEPGTWRHAVPVRMVRRGPPLHPSVLPEWLTAGIGGFARRHPAAIVFGATISLSLWVIGYVISSEQDGVLMRAAAQWTPASEARSSVTFTATDGGISLTPAQQLRSQPSVSMGAGPERHPKQD